MLPTPEEIIRSLPCWRGPPAIEPLRGGLSNANFKVTDGEGAYVVRVGRDFPFHHVSRRREAAATLAAEAAALAPRVVHVGDGVLVCGFIEGRTLEAADLRENLEAVVALIRRCHGEMRARIRGEATMFWVFHVIRDYADALRAGGHAIAPELPALMAITTELEAMQVPLPIVFGHHDLLPSNFLDDGRRLWLIDWEYAGFGTPMFDLANMADNGEFGADLETRMLTLYFDRAPDEATRESFSAMKLASALREMLWAMVSELHLAAPGVDYAAYSASCRTKFERVRLHYRESHGLPE
jgi:thiamine kinase-like enzyme